MKSNNQPMTIEKRGDSSRQPEEIIRLISDRLRITDISVRFVLSATRGVSSRSEASTSAIQDPMAKIIEPRSVDNANYIERAKATSENPNSKDTASFPIPAREVVSQTANDHSAVSGEIVDTAMDSMAEQARLNVEKAWGEL